MSARVVGAASPIAFASRQVLHRCYAWTMKSISQRELRNNSGEIMRGLAHGESYRITNRGVPVGVLTPGDRTVLDDLTLRAGSQEMTFPDGVRRGEATAEVLTELRGAR